MVVLDFFLSYVLWDRNKRNFPMITAEYKPSYLKRFICYLLNEKINPIDWEALPAYADQNLDLNYSFSKPKLGNFQPSECVSQPDMISKSNMYARRLVFFAIFLYTSKKINAFDLLMPWFSNYFCSYSVFNRYVIGFLSCFFLYHQFFHKDFLLPIN